MVVGLLPFICLSERFFQHAVGTSAGSLSPRTNWNSLAEFEFKLPTPDQQCRISEMLWAVDRSVVRALELLTSLETAKNAEFRRGEAKGTGLQRLESFTELISDGDHNPPKRTASGVPHVLVQNIRDGSVNFDECTFISEEDFERVKKRYVPRKNDVLIVCVGATIGRAGMVPDFVEFSTDRSLAVVRFDPAKVLPEYGFALVTSDAFQRQVQQNSVGTAQPHLFLGDIRRIQVAVPTIPDQQRVIEVLGQLGSAREAAAQHILRLESLREQLSLATLGAGDV